MGRFIAVVFAVLAVLFVVGCEKTIGDKSVLTVPAESGISGPIHFNYDMSGVITSGNRSYIPLDLEGEPHYNVSVILGALEAFEKTHPELEVTDWKIEKAVDPIPMRIRGIWVDHRPKR